MHQNNAQTEQRQQSTAVELLRMLANGTATPASVTADCRKRIEQREAHTQAWQFLDWALVEAQVHALAATSCNEKTPLWGLPIAVKDIYDTFDMPTSYGSSLYAEQKPAADAACIARLRAAGAIILGKTVTTEFAYWKSGKTRNPLNPAHTPGGSSSGSAASVADFMVPLAIGSQTAASTIRPASYCGIVGYKPSQGLISLAGVKALSNTLDTAGVFARSVEDVALLASVLSINLLPAKITHVTRAPKLRVWLGEEYQAASPAAHAAIEQSISLAQDNGATVNKDALPDPFTELCNAQTCLMAFEANRELAHEARIGFEQLSQPLQELLTLGESTSVQDIKEALKLRDHCLSNLDQFFGNAEVLVLPSTPGEAPVIEDGTGDPMMSRAWTLLGLPSITLPCGVGPGGLPLGLQLAAKPGCDQLLLGVSHWFENLHRWQYKIPKSC